jgi:hypothetical protein
MIPLTRWAATGPGSGTGSSSKSWSRSYGSGCSYESIADCACGATTIRERRDEWLKAGIFGTLKQIARESYDRMVCPFLEEPTVDRGKLGMKRSLMVEGKGIPLGRVLVSANQHDSPLLAATLDKLEDKGPGSGPGSAGMSSGQSAPRGALPYSRFSREGFGGRFLGRMAYLAPKG